MEDGDADTDIESPCHRGNGQPVVVVVVVGEFLRLKFELVLIGDDDEEEEESEELVDERFVEPVGGRGTPVASSSARLRFE